MTKKCILLFATIFSMTLANAQTTAELKLKQKKIEISSGVESSILQFALFDNAYSKPNNLKYIPRYSYFFNTGFDINYKINKTVYPFSGLYIKNIGLIQKLDSLKIKSRMYTIGAPLGLKIKASKDVSFKLGADFNIVFNYKEKVFIDGDKKSKFNEFFSNKTPLFYPSFFAGFSVSNISISANYYPQNFFNENKSTIAFTNAKLFTISAGINIDGKSVKKSNKK